MREIKFRAWYNGQMHDVTGYWWEEMGYNSHDLNEGFDHPLMQFTGLKDKNGVEIYEGDIVEHRNFIKELLGIYEVQWGQFGFTLFDPTSPNTLSHYISPDLLEVVGNVYENKDLLEAKNEA